MQRQLVAAGVAVTGVAAALALRRLVVARRAAALLNKLQLKTPVPPDVEISQAVKLTPIKELFDRKFGLREGELFAHGTYKGKLSLSVYERLKHQPVDRLRAGVDENLTCADR